MTLAALIRKRATGKPANANPANPANDEQRGEQPLARLATLALANPRDDEPDALQPDAKAFEERAAIMDADRLELVTLVGRVADHQGFTVVERQEALHIALADHVAALECFRALAEGMPTYTLPIDDRRFCTDCVNLRGRYCTVEKREQVLDVLQRCPTFKQRKLH